MIHLDANVLILASQRNSEIQAALRMWVARGEGFSTSAVAWTEFLNGPLSLENKQDAEFLIEGRVLPFTRLEAELAARLFNTVNRRRGSVPDCFIAATSIQAGVPLFTQDRRDFMPFTAAGLQLV